MSPLLCHTTCKISYAAAQRSPFKELHVTERIYYTRDALNMETDVLSCTRQEDERFHVVLCATLFHPQGGWQPSDKRTINGVNMLQAIQEGR